MTLTEAVSEVKKAAKRSGYKGDLTNAALEECARVYLNNCDADGTPRPRHYMRSGEKHRSTNLTEIQWLLVRTPSFKRWFGKSVIVDENGDPKVMYHGAWQHFNEFKTSFIKLSKTAMTLWSGPGFYFTDQEKVAKIYAGGANDRIYDVFLRMENPLVVDETGNAVNGRGITKKDAERIFLDGDNTQWLDSGLANELAKMDQDESVKGRGKPYYKAMTREQRVGEFVSRLKTDVVTLKTAAQAYGAKSQNRLLASICKHTGYDGVIHTLTPDVKEWVIYDPKAIKAANINDGEFSTTKAKTEDSAVEKQSIGDNGMANLIDSLKKIACDCADSNSNGYKAVMDSLTDISRKCVMAADAIDPEGKWITVHPNGAKEGEGRPIHLDKGGNIDSEGHLSNALKGKKSIKHNLADMYPEDNTNHWGEIKNIFAQRPYTARQNYTFKEKADDSDVALLSLSSRMMKKAARDALPYVGDPKHFDALKRHDERLKDAEILDSLATMAKSGATLQEILDKGKALGLTNQMQGNLAVGFKHSGQKNPQGLYTTLHWTSPDGHNHAFGGNADAAQAEAVELAKRRGQDPSSIQVPGSKQDLENKKKAAEAEAAKQAAAAKEKAKQEKAKAEAAAQFKASLKSKPKEERAKYYESTLQGNDLAAYKAEGIDTFEKIEDLKDVAKSAGKQLSSRFEVNDYEDADEHHYHAMMSLVNKLGGKVLYQDSPEYDDEEGESSYGYARGFTAIFPPDAAHELFTRITVKDGYHGEMYMPSVAK